MKKKYPIDPSRFFLHDYEKAPNKFYWWYQDRREFELWERLNSMTHEELENEKRLVELLKQKYGNIYFFKPFPAQQPIIESEADLIIVHGNNSSGKSYCIAAKIAYEIIGWSPYFPVKPTKYGRKTVWTFSANYRTQVTSAQEHLFANEEGSIGLLPPLKRIEKLGGRVGWGYKKNEIHFVEFPTDPPAYLEMRSAESSNISTAASAVDVVWLDEDPGETKYNEAVARVLRKEGRVYFSFLILPPAKDTTHYVSRPDNGLYKKWQEALEGDNPKLKEIAQRTQFFFLTKDDNLSLKEEDREFYTFITTESEAKMRYSPDGKWVSYIEGTPTIMTFQPDKHVVDDLYKQYDPSKTLFVAWDKGLHRPAVIAAQYYDRQVKIVYSKQGYDKLIYEMMDLVDEDIKNIFREIRDVFHILPHDANITNEYTGESVKDLFDKRAWDNTVIYTKQEESIELANYLFDKFPAGKPFIVIDSYWGAELISAINSSAVEVTQKGTRKRKNDDSAHLIDCLFKLCCYIDTELGIYDKDDKWNMPEEREPQGEIAYRGIKL